MPVAFGPLAPALTTERYQDKWAEQTQAEDERHAQASNNVIRINNANVTRHLGAAGIVDESFKTRTLTRAERADIEQFVKPKYRAEHLTIRRQCTLCGHVQSVASSTSHADAEGNAHYYFGSAYDFCDRCGESSMIKAP